MLKKTFYTFALFFLVAGAAVQAQTLSFSPSSLVVTDTCMVNSLGQLGIYIYVTNNSPDTLKMNWEVDTNSIPYRTGEWTVGICDPVFCYTSGAFSQLHHFTLNPGATSPMELEISPNCLADTGMFQVVMWATGDSATTLSYLDWKLNVCQAAGCYPAGISAININPVSLFPNPVRDMLQLTLSQYMDNGRIEIFNLIGSRVYSQPLRSRDANQEFDVSALESGMYIARISDGGTIITTKKFTKE